MGLQDLGRTGRTTRPWGQNSQLPVVTQPGQSAARGHVLAVSILMVHANRCVPPAGVGTPGRLAFEASDSDVVPSSDRSAHALSDQAHRLLS
jgi:hypothetical protein